MPELPEMETYKCYRCGKTIIPDKVGLREIFYCSNCQHSEKKRALWPFFNLYVWIYKL